jgi:hypothetical protein
MRKAFIPRTNTLTKEQKEQMESATDLKEAKDYAPWSCEVIEVNGGFMAFESATDLETWENQQ